MLDVAKIRHLYFHPPPDGINLFGVRPGERA